MATTRYTKARDYSTDDRRSRARYWLRINDFIGVNLTLPREKTIACTIGEQVWRDDAQSVIDIEPGGERNRRVEAVIADALNRIEFALEQERAKVARLAEVAR
jgi:hypothetical protein